MKTAFALVSTVVFLATCSGDNPAESTGAPNTGTTISPATTEAGPAEWVALNGVPASSSGLYGIVTTGAKAADTGYAAIVRADSGDFIAMPLSPSDPIGGGDIEVVITDGGTFVSEPISLTVDSLPAAPGEFAAIVSLMQQVLTNALRLNGLTRDSLAYQNASDVPVSVLPFVIAYAAIDNPDNPNSLRALANGPVPYLNNTSLDFDLVDRLLGQTKLREYFEEEVAVLDSTSVDWVPDFSAERTARASDMSRACIDGPSYGISTCGQLASAMSAQYGYEVAARSAAQKVVHDGVANTLMVVGLIPGAAPTAAAIGGGVWTRAIMDEGFQNMLPSEFVDAATSFDPSITDFKEDFTHDGHWSEFLVSAASNGWKLDRVALEAVMQILGARNAGDAINQVPKPLTETVNSTMEGMFIDNGTNNVIANFADQSGTISICPRVWGNIDCKGLTYSTVTSNTGRLDIDSAALSYKPNDIGDDIMRIETKNEFGQDNNTGTAVAINTKEIQIFLDPFQAEADTNQKVNFTVRVENAEDVRCEFRLDGDGSFSADQYSCEVTTPLQPWDPPMMLHAKSTASTGLRENRVDSDPREDSASITFKGGEFVIDPATTCLQPSQTMNFDLVPVVGTVDSVRWFTDPPSTGSIQPSGIAGISYTAPEELAGLITLYAIVNGEDTARADIDISDCSCYWVLDALGGVTAHNTGLLSIANALGDGLLVTLNQAKGNNDPPHVSILLTSFSGVGVYDSVTVIYTDVTPYPWAHGDTTVPYPHMSVSDYVVGDYMTASVTGDLHKPIPNTNPVEYESTHIALTFRAEFSGGVNETLCASDTSAGGKR